MPVRRLILILAIFTLSTVFSCADSPANSGPASGPRLAVLSPACAIILRDLGREDAVVARHGWDLVLDDALPVAGDQTGLDYETLLRLDPTDIVLEQSAQEIPGKLRELAGSQGWRVHTVPMLSLGDVRASIGTLARIAEVEEAAAQALAERFDQAISPSDSPGRLLGRVLPLTWTDPVGVMGPGSFHAELLASLGATPIPSEGGPYITLDTEDVIRLDPHSIVLIMPGFNGDDLAEALGPLASVGLRAVEAGRVVLIDHPHALTPSTSLLDVADALAARCRSLAPIGGSP